MKNIAFIIILTVFSSHGCQDRRVNSQNNTELNNLTNAFNHAKKNVNVAANSNINSAKNENSAQEKTEKPYTQKIQIVNAPKIRNSVELSAENSADEFSFWSKSFRWGSFCGNDSERISITFNQYAENKFVAEAMCLAGAYNFSYLFYDYVTQDESADAKLMNFEYFTTNEKSKLEKHFTYNLYGAGGFDKGLNRLTFRYYPVGGGRCGWENQYLIKNGKPILTQVKAQWNCEPDENGQDREWIKLDLRRLKKTAKNTIYDKYDE